MDVNRSVEGTMEEVDIDRHILRSVYELELIRDEYKHKADEKKYTFIDNTIEMILSVYPEVKEELEKEHWKL